jgi:hypothetical protein
MNLYVFISLLAILLISTIWIIPKFAPADSQVMIKDWVGIGFSGLLLVVALIETRLRDNTLAFPVIFYLIVLALALSGVYWWIPKFVPVSEQNNAIFYLFNSITFSVILANMTSPSLKVGYPYAPIVSAGRRR